jgi:hypothetical protein
LSQIRGGASLKRRESTLPGATAEKPVDTRSSLLENIRSGIKLKSAAPGSTTAPAPKKESAPSSVAEILARRVAIQGASDDEEDDDDDDWD